MRLPKKEAISPWNEALLAPIERVVYPDDGAAILDGLRAADTHTPKDLIVLHEIVPRDDVDDGLHSLMISTSTVRG